ncbi:TPA: hypothetical protein ACH74S_005696, partial [Escherichia coli]
RRRRDAGRFADFSGGHAGGAGLDEKPEHREARFLSDGRQGGYSIYRFHVSIIVEIWSVLNSSFKL